jgi:hypothetical protein
LSSLFGCITENSHELLLKFFLLSLLLEFLLMHCLVIERTTCLGGFYGILIHWTNYWLVISGLLLLLIEYFLNLHDIILYSRCVSQWISASHTMLS